MGCQMPIVFFKATDVQLTAMAHLVMHPCMQSLTATTNGRGLSPYSARLADIVSLDQRRVVFSVIMSGARTVHTAKIICSVTILRKRADLQLE